MRALAAVCGAAGTAALVAALGLSPGCASADRIVVAERVTLDATDPLRQTWCFGTDDFGTVMQKGELRNKGTQLGFGRNGPDVLDVYGSGGEDGVIVNLGSRPEPDDFGELTLASPEVAALPAFEPSQGKQSTAVKAGDLCLIRIEQLAEPIAPHAQGGTAFIKLQVLELEPGRRVAFRWSLL